VLERELGMGDSELVTSILCLTSRGYGWGWWSTVPFDSLPVNLFGCIRRGRGYKFDRLPMDTRRLLVVRGQGLGGRLGEGRMVMGWVG